MVKGREFEPNYAIRIIKRFAHIEGEREDHGAMRKLAHLLDLPRTTVTNWWLNGTIPQKHWQNIIDAGARVGVLVTPYCFVADLVPRELDEAA